MCKQLPFSPEGLAEGQKHMIGNRAGQRIAAVLLDHAMLVAPSYGSHASIQCHMYASCVQVPPCRQRTT